MAEMDHFNRPACGNRFRLWQCSHDLRDPRPLRTYDSLSARLARKKPTYIIEHSVATTMKSIYEGIWAAATVIVKF